MRSSDPACFGYQIRPAADGWAWVAFDPAGAETARGWAPQKALAAAAVIRALAESAVQAPREAA